MSVDPERQEQQQRTYIKTLQLLAATLLRHPSKKWSSEYASDVWKCHYCKTETVGDSAEHDKSCLYTQARNVLSLTNEFLRPFEPEENSMIIYDMARGLICEVCRGTADSKHPCAVCGVGMKEHKFRPCSDLNNDWCADCGFKEWHHIGGENV